jgi:hypothetical protein
MSLVLIGKIVAGILGTLLLVLNFVDIPGLISKIVLTKKEEEIVDKPVAPSTNKTEREKFLALVDIWYQFKDMCDEANLVQASDKLDDIFPLLNGVLDNEKDS